MTIVEYYPPVYKLRLYTTSYTKSNLIGTDVSASADTNAIGWLDLTGVNMPVEHYTIVDDIRQKSTMDFTVNIDNSWLLEVDVLCKYDNTVYYPKSIDGNSLTTDTAGTKLIVDVHDAGDVSGTVTITGTTVENGESDSEVFTITSEGTYIGSKHFTSVDASGIATSGLTADIGVWGLCDLHERKREIQYWVDGNDDGYYGLIFGGYIVDIRHNPVYGNDSVNVVCNDYTEFQMANTFTAGYRAPYICDNYDRSGTSGTCTEIANTVAWFSDYCIRGDMHPIHPNGVPVTEDDVRYSCSYYDSTSQNKAPFDGYSYDEDYAPDTDDGYEYYPPDYTRALRSLTTISNHLDNEVRSCDWKPSTRGTFQINGTQSDSDTFIEFDNYIGWGATEGDFIYVGTEFMKITSSPMSATTYYTEDFPGSGTFVVNRGSLNSNPSGYADDVTGVLWEIATDSMGVTSEDPLIIETDVSSTIYGTGKRYAETMTQLLEIREAVYWVDFYRQLHLTELDGEDPSYSGTLELGDDDVLAVEGLSILYNDICNYVQGTVTTEDGTIDTYYSADQVSGITNSINRFGISAKQIDTTQINVIGNHSYENNRRGWTPIAINYLKTHAYPISKQTVVLDGFYPSECYKFNTGNNNRYDLLYTDPYNEYIDIKGHQITCADYNLPDRPLRTWMVESIRYSSNRYGDAVVKIKMTRLTTESDFT
jgi:hypothetical protein